MFPECSPSGLANTSTPVSKIATKASNSHRIFGVYPVVQRSMYNLHYFGTVFLIRRPRRMCTKCARFFCAVSCESMLLFVLCVGWIILFLFVFFTGCCIATIVCFPRWRFSHSLGECNKTAARNEVCIEHTAASLYNLCKHYYSEQSVYTD